MTAVRAHVSPLKAMCMLFLFGASGPNAEHRRFFGGPDLPLAHQRLTLDFL